MRLTRAFSAALAAAFFATGCGGGGGGGGGNGGDPPIADAGDDGEGRLYQSYTLNGSQSEDPEGKDLSFAWSVLTAPDGSAATLTSSGAAAQVSFTPDREGLYAFGLIVDDGKKSSALDTVEIRVALRVAVFAASDASLAQDLEQAGAGQVDDFFAGPSSNLVAATGDLAIMRDERNRTPSLLAYNAQLGTLEFLVSSDSLGATEAGGDFVVWSEARSGREDLFARNMVTGEELRLTNSDAAETLQASSVADGYAVFTAENPPYGDDVFLYGLESSGLLNISDMDLGISESLARTDGTTVVYASLDGTYDTWGYDIAGQTTFAVATSTSHDEVALGVSGDFVILNVSTGGSFSLYRQLLSAPGNRVPIAPPSTNLVDLDGDYVLLANADGSSLRAHRLSTGTLHAIATTHDSANLANGVVAWSEFSGATSSNEVHTKVLPTGATTDVTATGTEMERGVRMLSSGVAWASEADSLYEVYFSGDGGTTVEHASSGKTLLVDALAEYDVAVVGSDVANFSAGETIAALTAAGVPVLSLDARSGAVADEYVNQTLYLFSTDTEQCPPNAVVFSGVAHPAFDGFAAGSYAVLEQSLAGYDDNRGTLLDPGVTPPNGWQVLASFEFPPSCTLDEQIAIATFLTNEGTAVILDGAASDSLAFWLPSRRELLLSELRFLASTRAP